jgi:hypothetical protein
VKADAACVAVSALFGIRTDAEIKGEIRSENVLVAVAAEASVTVTV